MQGWGVFSCVVFDVFYRVVFGWVVKTVFNTVSTVLHWSSVVVRYLWCPPCILLTLEDSLTRLISPIRQI